MNENSIERVTGYRVGQQIFTTVKEAQVQALVETLLPSEVGQLEREKIAGAILDSAEDVIAILSEKPELKVRKRRSDFGAKHTKKNSSPGQHNTAPIPKV